MMQAGMAMRRLLGLVIVLVALIGLFLSIVELLDPVGTKMADDGDPFGPPEPWYVPATLLLLSVTFGGFGLWLLFRKSRP